MRSTFHSGTWARVAVLLATGAVLPGCQLFEGLLPKDAPGARLVLESGDFSVTRSLVSDSCDAPAEDERVWQIEVDGDAVSIVDVTDGRWFPIADGYASSASRIEITDTWYDSDDEFCSVITHIVALNAYGADSFDGEWTQAEEYSDWRTTSSACTEECQRTWSVLGGSN